MGAVPGNKVRVAIVGVGNCASSLVQGLEYYKDATDDARVPGLMHVRFGDYHVSDIEVVDDYPSSVLAHARRQILKAIVENRSEPDPDRRGWIAAPIRLARRGASGKNAQIWADPANNALVITAPPDTSSTDDGVM